MKDFLKKYPPMRLLGILYDLACILVAWFGAWWLRFNLSPPYNELEICVQAVPVVFFIQTAVYFLLGQHKGIWTTSSIRDLANIFAVSVTGVLSITLGLFLYNRLLLDVPRSIPLLYFLLYVFCVGGARFVYRFFSEQSFRGNGAKDRVLVIGTDSSAEFLIRELLHKCSDKYELSGLMDRDSSKKGRKIFGVEVLGTIEELEKQLDTLNIQKVFIASSSIKGKEIRKIVESCHSRNIPCRIMPLLRDLISGTVNSIDLVREIRPEDLLGREPVSLDRKLVGDFLNGKTVLVTGAAGSIGSELCRQIAKYHPGLLIALDAREEGIFFFERSFQEKFPEVKLKSVLCNVCNRSLMEDIFSQYKPAVVFHAAAYKHVPLVELNPVMGMKNNLLGTINVAETADSHGAEKFVFISTDKAVNPHNVMGVSKRLGELYCLSLASRSRTAFIVTRFGNVLGSSGSVIPIFQKQLEKGGPLTVTHPKITRFFMCIAEACELVLQAAAMG
ncbi:MAG: polysaccharide biosynthesis protein, partial [Thermodesulfatator sp.]